MKPIEMAIDILRRTHDGEDLDPMHLRLVETAVNGWLSEAGEVAFYELHAQVAAGTYRKPRLHGVEHLTIDHQGYVRWKDHEVEHFTYYDEDSHARLAAHAQDLGRACVALEARGELITTRTVLDEIDRVRAGAVAS